MISTIIVLIATLMIFTALIVVWNSYQKLNKAHTEYIEKHANFVIKNNTIIQELNDQILKLNQRQEVKHGNIVKQKKLLKVGANYIAAEMSDAFSGLIGRYKSIDKVQLVDDINKATDFKGYKDINNFKRKYDAQIVTITSYAKETND